MRTFVSALANKARLIAATSLGLTRSKVPYVGYVGRRNFGDDLLLDIFRRISGRSTLPVLDTAALQPALSRSCVLGGGTVIGGPIYLDAIRRLNLSVESVFCAGVVDGDLDPSWVRVLADAAVFTRSAESRARLQALGVNARAMVDPAIFSQCVYDLPMRVKDDCGRVVLAVHGQHPFGHVYQRIVHAMTADERRSLVWMASSPSDVAVCRELGARFGGVVLRGWRDLSRTLLIIRDARFVVSTRLHPGICAASFGTPFRLLAYGGKHAEFAASIGVDAILRSDRDRLEEALSEMRSTGRRLLPGVVRWIERYDEFRLHFSAAA